MELIDGAWERETKERARLCRLVCVHAQSRLASCQDEPRSNALLCEREERQGLLLPAYTLR